MIYYFMKQINYNNVTYLFWDVHRYMYCYSVVIFWKDYSKLSYLETISTTWGFWIPHGNFLSSPKNIILSWRRIRNLSFPDVYDWNIRKLVLCECGGLTLSNCSFESEEEIREEMWKLAYGDEVSKSSIFEACALDSRCHLRLYSCGCGYLEKIPTFRLIEIDECRESAMVSAKEIDEEQQSE